MKFLTLFLCVLKITLGSPLPIPPLLEKDGGVFHLKVIEGKHEFYEGTVEDTFGYNGNILGPTIRMKKGDMIEIHVENTLKGETTAHWHGLRVIGAMERGPPK